MIELNGEPHPKSFPIIGKNFEVSPHMNRRLIFASFVFVEFYTTLNRECVVSKTHFTENDNKYGMGNNFDIGMTCLRTPNSTTVSQKRFLPLLSRNYDLKCYYYDIRNFLVITR